MQALWAWLNAKLGIDAGHQYVYRRLMMAESRLAYIEAWIANLDAEVVRINEGLGPQDHVGTTLSEDPKAAAKKIADGIMQAKRPFPGSMEALKR